MCAASQTEQEVTGGMGIVCESGPGVSTQTKEVGCMAGGWEGGGRWDGVGGEVVMDTAE